MRLSTLAFLIVNLTASAQNLTVTVPAGCSASPAAVAVTCGGPPPTCPPPSETGTPPNCVCAPGYTGAPPNCVRAGPISCPGLQTTVMVVPYTLPFSVAYSTATPPGFTKDGALVVQFTTPAVPVPAPTKGTGNVGTVEFQGSPATRTGSLSLTPCDFSTGLAGPVSTAFATQEPTVQFTLGYAKAGVVQLQPNTTYYLNEVNQYKGTNTCSNATCDVKVTITGQPTK